MRIICMDPDFKLLALFFGGHMTSEAVDVVIMGGHGSMPQRARRCSTQLSPFTGRNTANCKEVVL